MLRRLIAALSVSRVANASIFSPIAREKHLDVLDRYGLKAHLYLPSIGNRNNTELCGSLDALASAGYIITDSNGNLVGKVTSARLSNDEIAEQKRALLRIVD